MRIIINCIDCGAEKEIYLSDYRNDELLCYDCNQARELQAVSDQRDRDGCSLGQCFSCPLTDCEQNETPF